MTFILSKVGWALLRPSVLPLLLAWCGVALLQLRHPQEGRWLLLVGLGCYTAFLLLPLNNLALLPLEDRFPRPALPPHVDGIIVLSGAIDPLISRDRGIPSLNSAAERMIEAVILARRYPKAKVVFTGASSDLERGGPTEAQWAGPLLQALGVSADRILIEDRARDTYENAVDSRRLVRPAAGECWLLVTSAAHMPRAVGVFRHVDWDVTEWPVAYKTGRSLQASIFQAPTERLSSLDAATHEWLGLIAYRIFGWTADLFPGPSPWEQRASTGCS